MKNEFILEPLKILMVEDSKGDALFIKKLISGVFHNLHTFKHVTRLTLALNALIKKNFDVILLDRFLPDVSGFSGLLSIQNMAPTIPIIFLAGFKDENYALEAIENGAQDYIFKEKLNAEVIKKSIQFAINRKKFDDTLIYQANHDMLTGLANRTLFEHRVKLALNRSQHGVSGISIFFIDINGFKLINDSLGHEAGDYFLKKIACRLKKAIRPQDTAARFGGDEFALLIEGISSIESCKNIVDRILKEMRIPFNMGLKKPKITLSIGIRTCLNNETTSKDLISQADLAMYKAKASKNCNYAFYTE